MKRTLYANLAVLVACVVATLTMPGEADAQAKKPNILVIWGDDIGYSNISINSQGMMGYQTPNIDRLAAQGAVFTQSYSGAATCAPSRSDSVT